MTSEVKAAPNLRTLKHEKTCSNCEHCQTVILVGSLCEKYGLADVTWPSSKVCDDWEEQKTPRKQYYAGPAFI